METYALYYKRSSDQQDSDEAPSAKKRKVEYVLSNGKTIIKHTGKSNPHLDFYEYSIKSLEDVVVLDEFYHVHVDKSKTSNIPFSRIHKIVKPVKRLLDMVGLHEVKQTVLYLILLHLQKLDEENEDMLHTVVYGAPGVGKTMFIGILADIYAGLGVLPSNRVTFVKRTNLIAGYLGQTAPKTLKALEEAKGGVLVIDEAYSLGDKEQRDSFAKEVIDTLNQFLSENKKEIICVIAGYKKDLDERFFAMNPGLERRFPIRFEIGDYTGAQLSSIFVKIIRSHSWDVKEKNLESFFQKHRQLFKFNGGDMELLFTKVKFVHAFRVFGGHPSERKLITMDDIEKGLELFKEHKGAEPTISEAVRMMYM